MAINIIENTITFDADLNPRGAYDNATAYALYDTVSYQGSSYVALGDTTGNLPTNTTYWQLLAQKGDDGTNGEGFDWKDQWLTATAYVVGDVVQNNGSSYYCYVNHTSSNDDEPDEDGGGGPNWEDYWQIMALRGNTGANGADGAPGVGITWTGAYDNGTTYATNDAVSYNGNSYIRTTPGSGNLPTDPLYWNVMAVKGDPGDDGVVASVVAGTNIDVDNTDPANPIVSVENLVVADITDLTASATELNYVDGVTSAIQTQLNDKVDDSTLSANGKGWVNHGATAGTARPSGFASIEWYGSVEPSNAIDGDTWVNTSV